MREFFSMDGGFFTFLNKLFDLAFLSLLWVVFSLPIVTIGASTTALYYTTVKVIRKGRGYLFKSFWKSFVLNLKQGVLYTLLIAAVFTMFYMNFQVTHKLGGTTGKALTVVYVAMSYACFCCVTYLFPVLSRFTGSFLHTLKTSMLLAVKHYPFTFLMQIILIISGLILMFFPPLVIILPAGATATYSYFMEKVLVRYIPKDENVEDAWYLDHDA